MNTVAEVSLHDPLGKFGRETDVTIERCSRGRPCRVRAKSHGADLEDRPLAVRSLSRVSKHRLEIDRHESSWTGGRAGHWPRFHRVRNVRLGIWRDAKTDASVDFLDFFLERVEFDIDLAGSDVGVDVETGEDQQLGAGQA